MSGARADLKTPSVPAVERVLSILELLAGSRAGMPLPDIARELGLPKSSVHCLLVTLERRGYLHRNERTGCYLFGSKLFSLGNLALSGRELRDVAAPFLRALMEKTRLTVHLAVLERNEAVIIDKVEPSSMFKLATWLGKRMDVHCTGVGKALIAYLPDEELRRLVEERGLPRHNENSIVTIRKLKDELVRARRRGYAIDDEEDEIGLRCIGAPDFRSWRERVRRGERFRHHVSGARGQFAGPGAAGGAGSGRHFAGARMGRRDGKRGSQS